MITEYKFSRKALWKLILRVLVLLLCSLVLCAAFLFLSLVQWSEEAYGWVNAAQMITIILSIFFNMGFGGKLDGKRYKWPLCFLVLLALSVGAVTLWFTMSGKRNHFDMGVPLFVLNAVAVISLFNRAWRALRNSFTHVSGVTRNLPGNYILWHIPTGPSITDPAGIVLIEKGAVVFLVISRVRGYVRVSPNGLVEVREGNVKRPYESTSLSSGMEELLQRGKDGIAQVRAVIEGWCAANGYAPLKLNYDYMLYLPRFEPETHIYSATAFYHTNESRRYDRYEDYLRVANSEKKNYFKGKAAFSEWDLKEKLSRRWIYFRYEDAESAASELAAEILGEAYGLDAYE